MDLPTSLGLGGAAWAFGICSVLALLVICVTCIVLVRTDKTQAETNLKAFAEVIRSFRKQPKSQRSLSPPAAEKAELDRAA